MNRNSTHVAGVRRKGLAARAALAVLLGGGIALGGATIATPAFAKDKEKPEVNSKAFADAYGPFQTLVNSPTADAAAVKAMLPTVQATVQNNTDRDVLGRALVAYGSKANDEAILKQGIDLTMAGGKATPQQQAVFHFFLGKIAYDLKDYATARKEFEIAQQAGYTENDPRPAIAETYFAAGQVPEGLQYLSGVIKQEQAAGRKPSEDWVRRGLAMAYKAKLPAAADYAAQLVRIDPSPKDWRDASVIVGSVANPDAQGQLDLWRLVRATGALTDRSDYVEYVQVADPRRMASEVLAVLDEGVKKGVLTTGDQVYTEAKATATTRAAQDHKDAASLAADAKSAPTGVTAQGAGDVYYSFGDYAQAASLYQLALDKGGLKDRDMVMTRLGIAQALAGQYDAARAAFKQVGGTRAPIATMWTAYVDSKSAPAA